MGFREKMPEDYYGSGIVDRFNQPLYFRNPKIQYKLSLNHIEVIKFFTLLCKPKNFIELGTQFGETTRVILPLIPYDYIGVDIEITDNMKYLQDTNPKLKLYEMSTDKYFNNVYDGTVFDMAFVDASHNYEDTLRDFLNLKDNMSPDGIIFFHDTYPATKAETAQNLCGDCYKLPEHIRLNYNKEYEILTLPAHPGLSIARKVKLHIGDQNE
jgi:predicted O-methyltransferase YrrM